MSVTVGYFFNSEKGLGELGQEISGWLGCSLEPYEGDAEDLYDRFLAMELSLHTTDGYENDRELDFQNFGFNLDIRSPLPDANLRPILLPTMLAVVYALHRRLGITGMLVYGMQRLLARYEEREDAGGHRYLFDSMSGRAFEAFSQHLSDVEARLATKE